LKLDPQLTLETTRLLLRGYRPGDGPMYSAVSQRNREHLRRFEAGNPLNAIENEDQAEALVREFAAGWAEGKFFFFGAFCKDSGDFAAQVYVGPVNWDTPEFEIGYIADAGHEGKGYASEAVRGVLGLLFEILGAHRVRLECSEDNARSIRLAERCGFTREGHLRETKRRPDGSYSGDLIYGMLRKEYEAMISFP
jgi:RimJ/RimL family protein N-acetyltransferase